MILSAVLIAAAQAADSASPVVAIGEFNAVPAEDARLGSAAQAYSALLPGELSKQKGIRVVESLQRSEVMKEQALTEAFAGGSETLGGRQAGSLGTATGDLVVVGRILQWSSGKAVAVRLVTTAGGDVAGAWILSGHPEPSAAAAQLAPKIAEAARAKAARPGLAIGVAAGGAGSGRNLALAGAELLTCELAAQAGVRVVERAELAAVAEEAALSGKAPKISGVAVLLVVTALSGNQIEVKALDAASGQVRGSWKGAPEGAGKLAAQIAASLGKGA